MSAKTIAPYGSWKSPLDAEQIASSELSLSHVEIVGDAVYWNELRAAEGGRCVVVRHGADGTTDVVPAPFNARTCVHEYGGGAYLVAAETVLFSNFTDQRLYRVSKGGAPQPVTPEACMRYADGSMDERRGRILCVREDHTVGGREPVNTIAAINPDACNTGEVLVSGNDFYSSPRLSPNGSQLAWLTWNHPHMPWDAAELWVAPVREDGSLGRARQVAGGAGESVVQPEWSPAGVLYFVSDRTNWWNLYRFDEERVEPVTQMEAEFALPQWRFRMSSYAFADERRIVCSYGSGGFWNLAIVDTVSRQLQRLDTPFNTFSSIRADDSRAVFAGGSPTESGVVAQMDLETHEIVILRRAGSIDIAPAYISMPEAIAFPSENGRTAHGLFYCPKNPDYTAPPDEKPPLVVMIHGGPTAATAPALRPGIQYYTTRGIAVLDVNYGGSTGYGRAYREQLYGQWGVVDVDDCVNGARYLAERGLVDGKRLAITGGSAGGYTVLSALTFRDLFTAGASRYGVSDCEALTKETHKFESHYLDLLIAPYPERRDLYVERSPIHHLDRLACPVIFFQGLEDKIVPPNQAERMVAALRERGVPVAYVPFAGEQHGFRKSENIQRALEAELYFFSRIFGFHPADKIKPVEIENLDATDHQDA